MLLRSMGLTKATTSSWGSLNKIHVSAQLKEDLWSERATWVVVIPDVGSHTLCVPV